MRCRHGKTCLVASTPTTRRGHQSATQGNGAAGPPQAAKIAGHAPSGPPMNPAIASTPNVTITSPAIVNASGGTPEQNPDFARQVACETEQSVRAVVCADDLPQTEVTRASAEPTGV